MLLRVCILLLFCYYCNVNGEAFSATAHLQELVKAEDRFYDDILAVTKVEGPYQQEISDIIAQITERRNQSSQSGALFFAGHPINAYNLIKRWYRLGQIADDEPAIRNVHDRMKEERLQVPSENDFLGASAAIIRLQRTYNVPTDDFAKGDVFGENALRPLLYEDFLTIGDTAHKNGEFGLAAQWLTKAVENPDPEFDKIDALLKLAGAHRALGDFNAASRISEEAHELDPNNQEVASRMYSYRAQVEAAKTSNTEPEFNMTTWRKWQPDWRVNYEALCRGDKFEVDARLASTLKCRYKPGKIPYVVYKEEIMNWSPRISMFYDVISDGEAETVKNIASPQLFRAVVGDPAKAFSTNERVSKVAWLWDNDPNKLIKKLSLRVKDITGLETEYRSLFSSSEPFQVVNYGIGGQYEPHVDYYEDPLHLAHVPYFIKGTGDRLTTFLYYLGEIRWGGATVFPKAQIRVPPIKNAAAFWYNAKPSGVFDEQTQHAGCPVLLGQKWVTNKWIREYGQEFRRPCPLNKDAIDYS